MKQGLIEKISKNKELPKNILDVYRLLGYMNYKFGCKNNHINYYENLCLITKSINGLDWNPEINDEFDIFYPSFKFDSSSDRFSFYSTLNNKEYYYGTFALGFKTRELAEYAGRTFIDQYNKWLIVPRVELKLVEEVYYREIKTMSDVYRVNGIKNPTTPPETKERYYEDLILITKALNGNWQPNWSDISEYKHFPYFTFDSGLCFFSVYCICMSTFTSTGSCLYFKNKELADYAGQQFLEQYEKIMKF
jgi:hypothetical protein